MITVLALVPLVLVALGMGQPGNLLVAGLQLVYASDGRESPAWVVEAVTPDTTLGGVSGCAAIRLRIPTAPAAELRLYCVRGDTLLAWHPASQRHLPLRPLAPGMTLEIPGRTTVSTYQTGDATIDTVQDIRIPTLTTTVTTRDSAGRVVRRLRERYALALATAVSGVFEVPDATQPGGWRTERRFELVRLVRP